MAGSRRFEKRVFGQTGARGSPGKAGEFRPRKIQRGIVEPARESLVFTGTRGEVLRRWCSTPDRFMGIALSPMAQSKRESNGERTERNFTGHETLTSLSGC